MLIVLAKQSYAMLATYSMDSVIELSVLKTNKSHCQAHGSYHNFQIYTHSIHINWYQCHPFSNMALRMLTTIGLFYFIMCEDPHE